MSTKVFVGNLSFSTTSAELQTAFEAVGKVTGANIITRGRRSRGYGFVDFATHEDAVKAVEQMSKKEIAARQINVELAAPRDESAQPVQRPPRTFNPTNGAEEAQNGGNFRPRGRGRGTRGGAPRGTRGDGVRGSPRGRGGRGRGRGRGAASTDGAPTTPAVPVEPSKTTLFVANLPFSLTDDDLKKMFEKYSIKNAHIVTMKNGRSRGYGFVEFNDETTQLAALKEMEGHNVDTPKGPRALSIKAANSDAPHPSAVAADASAATTETATPTAQ